MKRKAIYLVLVISILLVLTSSTRAQVTCQGGPTFQPYQIGRIVFSPDPAQVCAYWQQWQAAGPFAAVGDEQMIRAQAQENVALALEAFRWRDPVIYNMVMQKYGLTVNPKQ